MRIVSSLLSILLLASAACGQVEPPPPPTPASVARAAPSGVEPPNVSPWLESQPASVDGWPAGVPQPEFGRDQRGYWMRMETDRDTFFYGCGAAPGRLVRNGCVLDSDADDAMPWIIAVRADGTTFGVLADTREHCVIDLRDGIVIHSARGAFSLTVFSGATPADVVMTMLKARGVSPSCAQGRGATQLFVSDDEALHQVGRFIDKVSLERAALGRILIDPSLPSAESAATELEGHEGGTAFSDPGVDLAPAAIESWSDLTNAQSTLLNAAISGVPLPRFGVPFSVDVADGSRWSIAAALWPEHWLEADTAAPSWLAPGKGQKDLFRSIVLRDRMEPYLRTQAYLARESGMPLLRPAFLFEPGSSAMRSEDSVYMLGEDVLVFPKLTELMDRALPRAPSWGIWRSLTPIGMPTGTTPFIAGRPGAIVPTWSGIRPEEGRRFPVSLWVCFDADRQATGWLYEDDGSGTGFLTGQYLLTRYRAYVDRMQYHLEVAEQYGSLPRPDRDLHVTFVTGDRMNIAAQGKDGDLVYAKARGGMAPNPGSR